MVFFPSAKVETKASDEYVKDLEERIKIAFQKLDTLSHIKLIDPEIIGKIGTLEVGTLNVDNINIKGDVYQIDELKINTMIVGDSPSDRFYIIATPQINVRPDDPELVTIARAIYCTFETSAGLPQASAQYEGCLGYYVSDDYSSYLYVCMRHPDNTYSWELLMAIT
jgi:hypothetical protein